MMLCKQSGLTADACDEAHHAAKQCYGIADAAIHLPEGLMWWLIIGASCSTSSSCCCLPHLPPALLRQVCVFIVKAL
jgi:hypothetical protein